jgi:uncharacterized protein YdeI (BOF family)
MNYEDGRISARKIYLRLNSKGDYTMKNRKPILIAVLALTFALFQVGTVFADADTPCTPVATSIAAILATPVNGQCVAITGTIDQVLEGNKFIISDGTGSITLDGGPAWFQQLALVVGTEYTVTGKVDLGKLGTSPAEIDLFSFTTGGVTTTIQQPGVRPPWAGGPNRQGKPGG